MEEPSGLLGALDVQVAEFLVVQRASRPALSLHLNQVSSDKFFFYLKSLRKWNILLIWNFWESESDQLAPYTGTPMMIAWENLPLFGLVV